MRELTINCSGEIISELEVIQSLVFAAIELHRSSIENLENNFAIEWTERGQKLDYSAYSVEDVISERFDELTAAIRAARRIETTKPES